MTRKGNFPSRFLLVRIWGWNSALKFMWCRWCGKNKMKNNPYWVVGITPKSVTLSLGFHGSNWSANEHQVGIIKSRVVRSSLNLSASWKHPVRTTQRSISVLEVLYFTRVLHYHWILQQRRFVTFWAMKFLLLLIALQTVQFVYGSILNIHGSILQSGKLYQI